MDRQRERREHKRIIGFFRVTFVPNSDFLLEFFCDARDISEGGIRIMITSAPLLGFEVEVGFRLPDSSDMLKIPSVVVWTKPSEQYKGKFEAGIKFLPLSSKTKNLLKEYITRHSR